MNESKGSRVLTVGPMPPEKAAYALARYSRSPDSISKSIEWVRTHNSEKFLESFYFQYGHASIADLGHLVVCLEGISELAATEAEDEQLWDGQARSSRYQDFSKSGFITPPEFDAADAATYRAAGESLLAGYAKVHAGMVQYLSEKLPRPDDMKPDVYGRNIAARAFDVARYFLFFGIPTGVGQVTSIRTLERQICRLKASEYQEVRELADEIAAACAAPPSCPWDAKYETEPIAPTLARYVGVDQHALQSTRDLKLWAEQNLSVTEGIEAKGVDLMRSTDTLSEIAATLLYTVTDQSYRRLLDTVSSWSPDRRIEVLDTALQSRTSRDELLRSFRGGLYCYDMVMDIGAYRDMHRHRRCQQFRQGYSSRLGYATPAGITEAGLLEYYQGTLDSTFSVINSLSAPASHFLLPFAAKSRFLFKMDFAEAEYISRLRSGVKGHFSYRQIAWEMKEKMAELEPHMAKFLTATPPWVEDPLKR
ncbi:MAG: FAD-dependent thymidylate synthase [Bryobacteraceae bacterium]